MPNVKKKSYKIDSESVKSSDNFAVMAPSLLDPVKSFRRIKRAAINGNLRGRQEERCDLEINP